MSYAAEVAADAPAGYWRMDEGSGSLLDASGNGRTAPLTAGSPTYGVPGLIRGGNRAVLFDGASSFTVPAWTQTDTLTLECWVRRTAYAATNGLLSFGAGGVVFFLPAGGAMEVWRGGFSRICYSSQPLTDLTRRYHIVYTKTGSTSRLYVDGNDVTVLDTPGQDVSGSHALTIGYDATSSTYWPGVIDEVAVYPAVLPPGRVVAHYLAGTAVTPPVTTVVWREPRPPHAAIYETQPAAVTYQQQIRGMGSAAVLVPRSDPNAAGIARLLIRSVPMVTIERDDGLVPFVGFPVNPSGKESDTHMQITLHDHTMLLNQAKARIAPEVKKASGQFLIEELTAMDKAGVPPLYIDLRYVTPGHPGSLALTGQNGDGLLREMEHQTGYDAFFTYDITRQRVQTFLQWQSFQGSDRTAEDEWWGGDQLGDVQYGFDNRLGGVQATTVGGTGSISLRALRVAQAIARGRHKAIGGSYVTFLQTLTDPEVMAARSANVLAEPRNAVTTWTFDLVESKVDMTRVGVGDIRVVGSSSAFLGQAVQGVVRIVSMQFRPALGVHQCVAVEEN